MRDDEPSAAPQVSAIPDGTRPGGVIVPERISGRSAGTQRVWVEVPDPEGGDAAWCYADRTRYLPGDTVELKVSSTIGRVRVVVHRDDLDRHDVLDEVCDAPFQSTPENAYEVGCGWATVLRYELPVSLPSGAYVVELRRPHGTGEALGHALFVVGEPSPRPGALALVLATSTWNAYNDWGGANHYFGTHPDAPRGRSPRLSFQRPRARGQVWLPPGAPRWIESARPSGRALPPRYDSASWAYFHGYSKYYAAAGWATFERHFVHWAEAEGYDVDLLTQDELHASPDALDGYRCAVFVGHDEYWTAEMRQTVDGFVDRGGRVARFAGNFMWQIRLDEDGRQIAYKYDARTKDPLRDTDESHRITSAWEDSLVGNPGATTFGVNAMRGMYAGFGGMAPRAPRGMTVFRPRHWAFARTGLGYADMMGDEADIFCFEMDGLDYDFRDGLPRPTHTDGAPAGLQILAMSWATAIEDGLDDYAESFMIGDGDARFSAHVIDGDTSPENVARHGRTSGMMVHFERGAGEVLTIATCEWVNGLIRRDYNVCVITRNILDRYLGEVSPSAAATGERIPR